MTYNEKVDIINEMCDKVIDLYMRDLPPEIMKTELGSKLMYDISLNMYVRLALALGVTIEEAQDHLATVAGATTKQKDPTAIN